MQKEEPIITLKTCSRVKNWNSHTVQNMRLYFKCKLLENKCFHEVLIGYAILLDVAFNVLQMLEYFTHYVSNLS